MPLPFPTFLAVTSLRRDSLTDDCRANEACLAAALASNTHSDNSWLEVLFRRDSRPSDGSQVSLAESLTPPIESCSQGPVY